MEIVNSDDLKKLVQLLDEAEKLLSQFTGGYSNRFLSAQEFHAELVIAIQRLKAGDLNVLTSLHIWFAPTCSWDDLVGKDGVHLGDKVYKLIGQIQK